MAVRDPTRELFFVEEIGGPILIPEEEPIFSRCARHLPFFKKCAEGGDARTGAYHDDRCFTLPRQLEPRGRLHEHFNGIRLAHAVGQKSGSHAMARASVTLIAKRADAQMRFAGTVS